MPPQEPREVRWSVNSPSPGLWYADPTTGERRPWPQGPPLVWPNGDTSRPLCADPVRCDTWIAGTSDEAPSHVCLWVGLHSLDVFRALHRWDEYEDLPPGLDPNGLTSNCGLPMLRPRNWPNLSVRTAYLHRIVPAPSVGEADRNRTETPHPSPELPSALCLASANPRSNTRRRYRRRVRTSRARTSATASCVASGFARTASSNAVRNSSVG